MSVRAAVRPQTNLGETMGYLPAWCLAGLPRIWSAYQPRPQQSERRDPQQTFKTAAFRAMEDQPCNG